MNFDLSGPAPTLGDATFGVTDDGTVSASVDGRMLRPGDGVAARIVDLLTGADPVAAGDRAAADRTAGDRERGIHADQTNTSVIVDDTWIVKLVSRWGGGERAAVQLDRLAAAESAADTAPAHLGALRWRHPERGTAVVALVDALVPGAEDGWAWAPADLVTAIDHGAPAWAAPLGSQVAGLHAALLPAPRALAAPETGAGLRARALAALDAVTAGDDATSERVRARRRTIEAELATLPEGAPAVTGLLHGDLHLGQLLRGADGGIRIIDFDGDPQRGADGAWLPTSPAADVVQLMCSIELAAAVAQRRARRVLPGIAGAVAATQAAFLSAYRGRAADLGLPRLLDEAWLPGLSAVQLIAELSYADAYLPRWRYAPDWAIGIHYPPATPDREPWTPPDFTLTFD